MQKWWLPHGYSVMGTCPWKQLSLMKVLAWISLDVCKWLHLHGNSILNTLEWGLWYGYQVIDTLWHRYPVIRTQEWRFWRGYSVMNMQALKFWRRYSAMDTLEWKVWPWIFSPWRAGMKALIFCHGQWGVKILTWIFNRRQAGIKSLTIDIQLWTERCHVYTLTWIIITDTYDWRH